MSTRYSPRSCGQISNLYAKSYKKANCNDDGYNRFEANASQARTQSAPGFEAKCVADFSETIPIPNRV